MSDPFLRPVSRTAVERALSSPRFDLLGRVGVDATVVGTWDTGLSRRRRILVPVDVQALVSGDADPVPVVPLTGRQADPRPFAAAEPAAAGVHLHWALPDALLAGGHDETTGELLLPPLPDTWVVVRTVQPVGRRTVQATGWVVDATTTAVVPLASYTGAFPAAPGGAPVFDPLTGMSDGPSWTASYAASRGRFGFHDPLTDLADLAARTGEAWDGEQAVYTVAGWWRDSGEDPLAGARGPEGLDAVLARLGWSVDHEGDETVLAAVDPRVTRIKEGLGLDAPDDEPAAMVVGADGRRISGVMDATSFAVAYPVERAGSVVIGDALPRYDTLVHGSVLGVPVGEVLPPADDAPDGARMQVALGSDLDDVIAAFGAATLPAEDARGRAAVEDVVAAFSAGLASRLGATDGLDDLGEREHASGFWALPGAPVEGSRADRLRVEDTLAAGPLTVGRRGRGAYAAATGVPGSGKGSVKDPSSGAAATLSWRTTFDLRDPGTKADAGRRTASSTPRGSQRPARSGTATAAAREVPRPAPRAYRPAPLVLAVRGAHPSLRHHGDGLYDDDGRLGCRYPGAAVTRLDGIVDGVTVLPTLGSGAIPDEVTTVVREAVILNPYGQRWLVDAAAPPDPVRPLVEARVAAEMLRLYGTDGTYDGSGHVQFAASAASASSWQDQGVSSWAEKAQVAAELAAFSTVRGTPPSPVAHTTWRQPWVPLWVEWQVTLRGSTTLRGWELDGFDLEHTDPPVGDVQTTLTGRSILGRGVGDSVQAAVASWVGSEAQRQATSGRTAFGDEEVLRRLAELKAPLDLVSASLDGIREQLLGIDFVGLVQRAASGLPVASGSPTVLFGGLLRLDALRLVDAFGRLVELPAPVLDDLAATVELAVEGDGRSVLLRPRLQGSARWLWRLVGAATPAGTAPAAYPEAYADQLDPAAAVNPVAGFLLPDHVDESLEVFTSDGKPLGEVGHDPVTGAVRWEPAPGRPVPPDAGPLVDVPPQSLVVAQVAAALVRADAAARALAASPPESALTVMLRAVDTTLWTVDSYAALGSGTVAGLVGRPVAVVRTTLRLEAPDDVAEVEVTAPGGADARRAAFAALAGERVAVHLGSVARADDALLGYFVDDDFERFHLVDKVLAAHAKASGRLVGQLGLLGDQVAPDETTLDHPYLVTDGRLFVHPGQTVVLTLLMLPAGSAHLTSGLLPRKELRLADSWVTPGLTRLLPSVRVGPVLVDPAEIRLPLVSLLGDKQTFTRRTGELAWRDDPILAATQTAYLPRLPHEAQEGWVRVTPVTDGEGSP